MSDILCAPVVFVADDVLRCASLIADDRPDGMECVTRDMARELLIHRRHQASKPGVMEDWLAEFNARIQITVGVHDEFAVEVHYDFLRECKRAEASTIAKAWELVWVQLPDRWK